MTPVKTSARSEISWWDQTAKQQVPSLTLGAFSALATRTSPFHFQALRVERHGDSRRIVVDAMKESVQAAPTFTRSAGVKAVRRSLECLARRRCGGRQRWPAPMLQ